MQAPCEYAEYGCDELVLLADMPSHKATCTFRPLKCIFAECDEQGELNQPTNQSNQSNPTNPTNPTNQPN